MTKEQIKKLLDESKKGLALDHESFEKSIEAELSSFKKKTLEQI